eukprot:ctg_199.g68
MTYTLTYFPIRGRAGHIVLLLEDLKIPHNHKVVQFGEKWQSFKTKGLEMGKLFWDKCLCYKMTTFISPKVVQSLGIARKHNKYGANETEMALNDMIFEMSADIQNIYVKFIFDKKHNEKRMILSPKLRTSWNLLSDSSNVVAKHTDDILKEFPHLESLYQRMKSRSNIAAYLQSDR